MFILSAVVHFIGAMLIMILVNWAGLIPWERAVNAHWTERARLLWPVRYTAAICVFLVPFILNQVHWFLNPHDSYSWIALGIISFLGALLGCFPLDRRLFPRLDFRTWCQQTIVWWGIRLGIWVFLGLGVILMPAEFGWKTILVAASYMLVHCLFTWGLFLRYLRVLKFVKPAGPRLQTIVDATVSNMGGAYIRATWEMGGRLALAFAFPVTRELAFSERALEICSDEEIAAVCAHEIAHLKESKWVLAARLFGSLIFLPIIFISPVVSNFGLWGLLVLYLLMFAILIFTRLLSRKMEKNADEQARKVQSNEGVYARALEKFYRENLLPAVNVNNRQTHPHLYDRLLAAGITPDFPRPKRPKRLTLTGWAFVFAFVSFTVLSVAAGW